MKDCKICIKRSKISGVNLDHHNAFDKRKCTVYILLCKNIKKYLHALCVRKSY